MLIQEPKIEKGVTITLIKFISVCKISFKIIMRNYKLF